MIPGKMFREADYDPFFAYGPGAMMWSEDKEGRRQLWFLAPPDPGSSQRFATARIYTNSNGKDWCVPGDVNGWDGNEERPTLHPSIWLHDRRGWHGFVREGNLHTA